MKSEKVKMAAAELTVLDENGECPICSEKPDNLIKTPCCKTIVCQNCLWFFNDGKTEHKCTNCNTNITLLFRERKAINDLNSGEISFEDFFDRYPRVIKESNVHKLSTERLFKKNDHFMMYIAKMMKGRSVPTAVITIYEHIKTSINWRQDVNFGTDEVRPLAYAYLDRAFDARIIVDGIKTLTEADIQQVFPGKASSYLYLMSRHQNINKAKDFTKQAYDDLTRFIISLTPRSILDNIKILINFFRNGRYSIVSDLLEFISPDSLTYKTSEGKTIVDMAFESNDRAIICQIMTIRPDIFSAIECKTILRVLLTNHDIFEEFKDFMVDDSHSLFEMVLKKSTFSSNEEYKQIIPSIITFFKKYGRSEFVQPVLTIKNFKKIVNYACSCGRCIPVLFSEKNFFTRGKPFNVLDVFSTSNLQEIHQFLFIHGTKTTNAEFKKMTEHLRLLPPSVMPLAEAAGGGGRIEDDTCGSSEIPEVSREHRTSDEDEDEAPPSDDTPLTPPRRTGPAARPPFVPEGVSFTVSFEGLEEVLAAYLQQDDE